MVEFVRRFQRNEPLTNLSPEDFGADCNDDETRFSLGCVPSVDQRLDASHPVRFARLAVALRVIKVETHAALQVAEAAKYSAVAPLMSPKLPMSAPR